MIPRVCRDECKREQRNSIGVCILAVPPSKIGGDEEVLLKTRQTGKQTGIQTGRRAAGSGSSRMFHFEQVSSGHRNHKKNTN